MGHEREVSEERSMREEKQAVIGNHDYKGSCCVPEGYYYHGDNEPELLIYNGNSREHNAVIVR